MKIHGEFKRKKGYCLLGKKMIPRGSNCFYWALNSRYGIKVYHGLDRNVACSKRVVMKITKKMTAMHSRGLCVGPLGIVRIQLDIGYNCRRVKKTVFGIMTKTLDMKRSDTKKQAFIEELPGKCERSGFCWIPDYSKDCNVGYDRSIKAYQLVDIV